jgi:effector-binding domain-containing protein
VLDTPRITESADQLTALIPLTVPSAAIQEVMGPGIREVFAALAAQGVAPAGPWFTHHRRPPTDTFDFDICVPVAAPVAAAGRVRPGRLPAARVARAVYRGPYEGLAAAWGEFHAWVVANGHTPRADLWECYLVGPESGDDPAGWRTELNRPLVG